MAGEIRGGHRHFSFVRLGKVAGKGVGMLAGAGVAALLGLGALTAMLIVILDSFMNLWLAVAILTVLWLALAAILASAGRKALKESTPPAPQTVETVKEDVQWAKTQTKSAKR
jgi:membrane protein implicated in regulation of membrane protease activity